MKSFPFMREQEMNDNYYNQFSPYRDSRTEDQGSFRDLEATELFCPECRRAVPVIKRLLLVLPEGDKYEYRCRFCGTTVGDKIDNGPGSVFTNK
jgi:hypothetical protein